MCSYWDHIDRIPKHGFLQVDWISLEKVMLRQKITRQHWISKHASNTCGTNDTLVKWKQKQSVACPRCGEIENAIHVWKCRHAGADTIWDQFIKSLGTWLHNTTSTSLTQLLVNSLQEWRAGSMSTNTTN
jgi:predicted RNA-binding Zn-ribbon protein involved in translation (DUF1610 family)